MGVFGPSQFLAEMMESEPGVDALEEDSARLRFAVDDEDSLGPGVAGRYNRLDDKAMRETPRLLALKRAAFLLPVTRVRWVNSSRPGTLRHARALTGARATAPIGRACRVRPSTSTRWRRTSAG